MFGAKTPQPSQPSRQNPAPSSGVLFDRSAGWPAGRSCRLLRKARCCSALARLIIKATYGIRLSADTRGHERWPLQDHAHSAHIIQAQCRHAIARSIQACPRRWVRYCFHLCRRTARYMGGKVQEGFGRVTGDAKSQADGINQATGAAQDLYRQAKDVDFDQASLRAARP